MTIRDPLPPPIYAVFAGNEQSICSERLIGDVDRVKDDYADPGVGLYVRIDAARLDPAQVAEMLQTVADWIVKHRFSGPEVDDIRAVLAEDPRP